MNIISAKNARKESTVTPTVTMVTEEELDAAIKKASSMGKTQILVRKESLSNSMKRALESLGYKVTESLSFDTDTFYKITW